MWLMQICKRDPPILQLVSMYLARQSGKHTHSSAVSQDNFSIVVPAGWETGSGFIGGNAGFTGQPTLPPVLFPHMAVLAADATTGKVPFVWHSVC